MILNNLLSDITGLGLCSSVKEIKLAFNKIGGTNEVRYFQAVKLLVRLTILDLRSNGIRQVLGNLTWHRPNLEMFYMGDDEIHNMDLIKHIMLPWQFFHHWPEPQPVDLYRPGLICRSEQLTEIHLHNNQLTDIPRPITKPAEQASEVYIQSMYNSHLIHW